MKKIFRKVIILFIAFLFIVPFFNANAYVSVNGYYKANGTYVAPYVRSNPNGVKYDNYGYKPSQGLYNDSYGTKGATWDTPTYVTDPSYYVGKNLYDSNQAGTYSSPSYNLYTPSATPSCPSMSSYDSYSKTCKCYSGYSVGTDLLGKEACVSDISKCQKLNGYNSTYNSFTDKCECSYSYIYNGKECVSSGAYCRDLIGLMSSYNSLTKECECMSGYELVGSICTYKSTYFHTPSNSNQENNNSTGDCPTNSSMKTGGTCYCNTGYKVTSDKSACQKIECDDGHILINDKCLSYNESCIDSYGNAHGDKQYCYCDAGYEFNSDKTLCVIKASTGCELHATLINDTCICNWPYKTFSGECQLLTEHEKRQTGKIDNKLTARLAGNILSQNEEGFVLWWVNPEDKLRYQLESSTNLLQLIQSKAKMYDGKTVANLKKNPSKVLGKFIIDKTNWKYYFVNPKDKKFYNIAPSTSYAKDDYTVGLDVLRKLATGMTNSDIRKIKVAN